MNDEIKQKLKLPENHEIKIPWYREENNRKNLISMITYCEVEEQYYLWKVNNDGMLEQIITKHTPDFSASELNVK